MFQLHEVQRAVPLPSRYVAPGSLDEAANLLSSHGAAARLIAGGTDLMLELSRGARSGVELLVDISGVAGLDRVSYEGGRVTLGPLVTHADVIASAPMLAAGLPLAQACLEVGSPPLRNRATVVGNIVTASPANDTISALVALGAEVTMMSPRGERTVRIGEFFTGFRQTVLEPDEIVTAIAFDALDGPTTGAAEVPRVDDGSQGSLGTDRRRGIFVKLGLRRAQAISVVHAAVVVHTNGGAVAGDGIVSGLIVALGSVAPTIITVPQAAELAMGRELTEAADDIVDAARRAATPIDDIRGSAEYRSHAVGVVVERAVAALAGGTEAERWPHEPPRLVLSANPDRSPAAPMSLAKADDVVTATVNGSVRGAAGAAGKTLMDWLRDDLGLTGTKEGCAEGECGACTVHLDGAVVFSCLVPAGRAEGATITTVEGVASPAGELHPFQQAMVDTGGAQCGFCTPGFVMSAAALLNEIPEPTSSQIAAGLSGNLCRCTGYCTIIEAVRAASVDAVAVRTASVDTQPVRSASVDSQAVEAAAVDAGAVPQAPGSGGLS